VVSGEVGEGDTIHITQGADGLKFEVEAAPAEDESGSTPEPEKEAA
jgi:hypothetical protein